MAPPLYDGALNEIVAEFTVMLAVTPVGGFGAIICAVTEFDAGFIINQRVYVSAATLASGAYGHDRWKAGASGGNYSFTQLASNTQITIASGKSLKQVVEDKNVVLGDTATPTDVTADGGGITLKGATDKTFNWVDATDAWTSSEHINLASGKTLKYNGTDFQVTEPNYQI